MHGPDSHCIRRRRWRAFDFNGFCDDLSSSALLCDPQTDAVGLFTSYHNTMQVNLVDKHDPIYRRRHASCSHDRTVARLQASFGRGWDETARGCLSSRWKSDENRIAWRKQSRPLRFTLQQRYVDYWLHAINSNIGNPKALWSKINLLLMGPQAPTTPMHTAEDSAIHFRSKVDAIRTSTLGAPPLGLLADNAPAWHFSEKYSLTRLRRSSVLHQQSTVSLIPHRRLSGEASVGPITFANMVNATLDKEGVFPDILKYAIVRPWLKKSDAQSRRPQLISTNIESKLRV